MKIMCNPLLPPAYQEVEYIQGDGRSYINSNFIPSYADGFDIQFKFSVNSTSTSLRYCLLSNYNKAPNPLSLELQSNKARFWQSSNLVDLTGTLTTGINTAQFKYLNGTVTCSCNGVTNTGTKNISGIPTQTMQFFCDKELRTSTFNGYMKLYLCTIFVNDTLARKFIPCYRKSDNKIGLYELVENVFLPSDGSVNFTKGNNVVNHWEGVFLESSTIPAYYRQVEYIASSGSQYIDLDYICKTNNLNIELDMMWTGSTVGAFETFAGFMKSSSQTTPRIGLHKYTSNLMFGANATQTSGTIITVNERFVYKGDFTSGAQKLYKNGSQITSTTTTYNFSTNTCPLYLFARYCPNSMNYATMRLYSCTIKEGTTTVRNLIPCYNQMTTEIGLYDLVTKTFYTNAGTGAFTKGDDITSAAAGPMITLSPALPEVTLLPKIYRRVSYISSSGTAYLDTGLPVHMNWKYEIDFQQNNSSTYRAWGAFNQSSYTGPNCSLTYVSSSFAIRWESRTGNNTNQSFTAINTNRHKLIIDNGVSTFDNTTYAATAGHNSNFVTSYNAYLFTINPGGTAPSSNLNGKIYSYKVWNNNGALEQWFIPCENKITGEVGMYDIIKQEFHGSISAGNFEKGEVI